MHVERKEFQGHYYHVGREGNIVWGFTEKGFSIELFSELFPVAKVKFLKQIHSDIIFKSSEIKPDSQGDGIIVDEENVLALIKTADCVPLFFWAPDHSFAGILHIGWRGFQQGIQETLLRSIKKRGMAFSSLHFFMGPAIGANCYEVGPDLYTLFESFKNRGDVFSPSANNRYTLDLKRGISLSLQAHGVQERNIRNSNICTLCQHHTFPSYRKNGKSGERIFNFLLIG